MVRVLPDDVQDAVVSRPDAPHVLSTDIHVDQLLAPWGVRVTNEGLRLLRDLRPLLAWVHGVEEVRCSRAERQPPE